jgi:hypothetical protein
MAVSDAMTDAAWMKPILATLMGFLDLPDDWNSYGAPRIDPGSIGYALSFLVKAMQAHTPKPAAIPSPTGGVQLEWHEQGIDLEVEVLPGGSFGMYFANPTDRVEEEVEDLDLEGAVALAGNRIKMYLDPR